MGTEATGGVIGGVAGYMIGGWQGELQGTNYGMMAGSAISRAFQACFTGDVLARARGSWGEGWRRFDLLDVGDEVLSRDEYNANGPLEWKRVEEKFVRTGRIWHLHFDGAKLLRTTGERREGMFAGSGEQLAAVEQPLLFILFHKRFNIFDCIFNPSCEIRIRNVFQKSI